MGTTHPLDPLSAEEIGTAAAVLRADPRAPQGHRTVSITLHEPSKPALREFEAGGPRPERVAEVVLYDRPAGMVYEAEVSLDAKQVLALRAVPGVHPPTQVDEVLAAEEAVKADPGWQAALHRRGIDDLSRAHVEPWPAGHRDTAPGRRITRALTWIRSGDPRDNPYARPVENLVVLVDLADFRVLEVQDGEAVPLPLQPGNYIPELATDPGNVPRFTGERPGVRALEITQPNGPSFTLDGHEVRWQHWRFRVGFTPREGLVLHQVRYDDRGRERPVLHRASVSEMWVPYGDPAPIQRIKNVFDEGEIGMGTMANSLELGCDCLGEIRYLDAVVNDHAGNPAPIPNAVCVHEEDTGVAWKHTDFHSGHVEVRRGRRLVVSQFYTVGNYEYGYFWYFGTDASIHFEVKLTGIITTGAFAAGQTPAHGELVAPGLYGPHHQHYFCVRLDPEIDGPDNTVVEVDSVPAGAADPVGNAWMARATPLERESAAARRADPAAARTWRIVNERVRNHLGRPVAYELVPGPGILPLNQPDHPELARGAFALNHLWVTAYDPVQRFAAGDYPYQNGGGDGLPAYAAADRRIRDTDLVVWHTLGAHHVVRPEDWPVMPVTTVGFHLRPVGFFDGNPALDLPRPAADECHMPAGRPGEPPATPPHRGH